jgi:RND family efflux transporter MFP subunit
MLILLTILAGCATSGSQETAGTADGDPATAVRVQAAEDVVRPHRTTASGVVQAKTPVDVSFQVPGKVVLVGPDEGDAVRAGQLLAQIDTTDYRFALDQAAAQADRATQERERYQPLLASGSVAPNDFERIESGARQAVAAAGLARKRLADTRLVAPLSGVVAHRAIQPGETASAGQTVFTIVDVDPVKVRIGVPESEIGGVQVGQRAEVRVPALGDEPFAGRVTLVGIAADSTTRTYAVGISVPNPAQRLKVGMVAEATVEGARVAHAIVVPASAVVRDANGATVVYVLDSAESRVHARRVEIGEATHDAIDVTRGLAAGEPVVVAGEHRVREGSRVLVESPVPTDARLERAGGAQ